MEADRKFCPSSFPWRTLSLSLSLSSFLLLPLFLSLSILPKTKKKKEKERRKREVLDQKIFRWIVSIERECWLNKFLFALLLFLSCPPFLFLSPPLLFPSLKERERERKSAKERKRKKERSFHPFRVLIWITKENPLNFHFLSLFPLLPLFLSSFLFLSSYSSFLRSFSLLSSADTNREEGKKCLSVSRPRHYHSMSRIVLLFFLFLFSPPSFFSFFSTFSLLFLFISIEAWEKKKWEKMHFFHHTELAAPIITSYSDDEGCQI